MKMNTYAPGRLLAPFVKAYLIIESQDELVNRVLPDTSLVMAFRYKGEVNYLNDSTKMVVPRSVLSGLRKSGRLINYTKDTGNFLVIFKEATAHAFVQDPLHELLEGSVPLDSFKGYQNLSILEEQLAEATDDAQRILCVEKFLLSRIYNYQEDKLVSAALEKIHHAKGSLVMKELAHELCISQDAFEKRFRRLVGMSPKPLSYIVRMKNIVSSEPKHHSLTELALDAGYYDQAHFNKDFKLFTGQTPTAFRKAPVFW